jgi:carboxymethylenebutenolidase
MGQMLTLTSSDGFKLAAYLAQPSGKPRGAMIVVQEIFGVNRHIKGVADGYAADGYVSIAPAFFDRVQPGLDLGYGPADIEIGRGYIPKVDMGKAVQDLSAAVAHVTAHGKVGVVGYCWGGRVSWVSSAQVDGLACAVSYYGGGVPGLGELKNKVPVMFHWGELDQAIPLDSVNELLSKRAELAANSFVYKGAGHGFNCDERGSYNAESAKVARERTLDFLRRHIG